MDYQSENEPNKPAMGRRRGTKGFWLGMLVGLIVMGAGLILGIKGYAAATNSYVIVGPKILTGESGNTVLDKKTVDKIEEIMSYVDLYYRDSYDEKAVREDIYKGTLEGLGDKYSVYYTKDEYKELQMSTKGHYYGIGVGLSQDVKTMEVTVAKVYSGTPAEKAGLLKGDKIIAVGETDASGTELSDLVKKVRGKEGTTVHLKVYRESEDRFLEMDIRREDVDLPSVESKMLDHGIGYICISEFQENTVKQFQDGLKSLQKENMKSLIVDLRDNPGGLITSVVDILDLILPEGTVVYTEDKYGKRDTYTSDADCLKCPIAVLVNEGSASSSEIFAGAIQDYNYGTIVGRKTYGKGIVQTIFPLEDGSAVKLTTSKYYTPKGHYIHGAGIKPDIDIEYKYSGPKNKPCDMKYDNQLQKAIEVLE